MITFTSHNRWPIYDLDVKTTFLDNEFIEKVYIKQLEGSQIKGQKNKVYLLQKVIYGLRQAPCAWYIKINMYIHNQGLTESEANAKVYFSIRKQNHVANPIR